MLTRESPGSSLSLFLPCGGEHGEKMAMCEPGDELPPDPGSDSALSSDFLASRAMHNKCLLFKPPILWYCDITA